MLFGAEQLGAMTYLSAVAEKQGPHRDEIHCKPAASGPCAGTAGQVRGKIDLDVFTEVLGPFQIIPRSVLEAGGDAVMRTLVGQLLPTFLRRSASEPTCIID